MKTSSQLGYVYEGATECERGGEFVEYLSMPLALEMPPHCRYTEADFQHIECRGCELE